MPAYGREMEREYSAQSILAGEGSETGSSYTTEAGVYMSAFAATVLVSGLVTVGISAFSLLVAFAATVLVSGLVTVGISAFSLLVALAVMLNSCERWNFGVLEMCRNTENYDYCRNLALHAELNSISEDHFPAICTDINTWYIKEGQYKKDLNITVAIADEFFSSTRPQDDGRDVVLVDADDFLTSDDNLFIYGINGDVLHDSNGYENLFFQPWEFCGQLDTIDDSCIFHFVK